MARKIAGKDFDFNLKLMQSSAVYYANKSKAGTIGGSVCRLKPEDASNRGEAMGLANFKNKTIDMPVYCRSAIGQYEPAKHYTLKINTGINHPEVISPYQYQFKNWIEFLKYFKRMKVL